MTLTKKAERLFQNQDFQDLILEGFINKGINELVLNENVDSDSVRDQLKARKILSDYLQYCLDFDSIEALKNN